MTRFSKLRIIILAINLFALFALFELARHIRVTSFPDILVPVYIFVFFYVLFEFTMHTSLIEDFSE